MSTHFPAKKRSAPRQNSNHFFIFSSRDTVTMARYLDDILDGPDLVDIFNDTDKRYEKELVSPEHKEPEISVSIHTRVKREVSQEIMESCDDMHKVLLDDPIAASFFANLTPDTINERLKDFHIVDTGAEGFPRGIHGQFFCRHCNKHFGNWKNCLKLFCGDLECAHPDWHHEYLCEYPDGRRWYLPAMMSSGFEDPPKRGIILDGFGNPILKNLYYVKKGCPVVKRRML